MKHHDVDRRYLALVRGAPEHDAFSVEAPLGRRAARIIVDRVEGRAAATAFVVRERLPRTALLEAAPRTGRTHEIRVHLQAIGHPIVGDRNYGGGGDEARRARSPPPFLHSWRLSFAHPITGERLEVEEPLRRLWPMRFGTPAPTCALDAPMTSTWSGPTESLPVVVHKTSSTCGKHPPEGPRPAKMTEPGFVHLHTHTEYRCGRRGAIEAPKSNPTAPTISPRHSPTGRLLWR